MKHISPKYKLSPLRTIVLGYSGIILFGALLLVLPISSRAHCWTSFADALFTSTSATCVTGLIVQDTYTYWSLFGQIVILLLIQVGGIGFMTFAISALMLTKQKIGLRNRYTLQESVNAPQVGGIVRMTRFILLGTGIIEGSGAVLLALRFCPQFGFWKGLYFAVFHAISAFCNAGFDLMGGTAPFSSLTGFVADPLVNIVIIALIVLGGLGFFVWSDVITAKFRFRKCKLHTKVVLITTLALIIIPFILILFFEYQNPIFGGKTSAYIFGSLFQTVTTRTAGFNTADIASLSDATIVLMFLLMLIGGSPSSTAGGLKTTTFAMLSASIFSVFRQRKSIECFKRRIGDDSLLKIIAITAMYIFLFFTCGMLLCAFDDVGVKEALFETASAIGTVGITLGITSELGTASHIILILLMFFGRVGGLTLLLAFHDQGGTPSKYPVEKITIG